MIRVNLRTTDPARVLTACAALRAAPLPADDWTRVWRDVDHLTFRDGAGQTIDLFPFHLDTHLWTRRNATFQFWAQRRWGHWYTPTTLAFMKVRADGRGTPDLRVFARWLRGVLGAPAVVLPPRREGMRRSGAPREVIEGISAGVPSRWSEGYRLEWMRGAGAEEGRVSLGFDPRVFRSPAAAADVYNFAPQRGDALRMYGSGGSMRPRPPVEDEVLGWESDYDSETRVCARVVAHIAGLEYPIVPPAAIAAKWHVTTDRPVATAAPSG